MQTFLELGEDEALAAIAAVRELATVVTNARVTDRFGRTVTSAIRLITGSSTAPVRPASGPVPASAAGSAVLQPRP